MSDIREGYILKLTEDDRATAKDTLQEIPEETASHIETLRTAVKQMKHLSIPDDDEFLLKFLRHAKFSQRRAREVLDSYTKQRVTDPYKKVYTSEAKMSPGVINVFKKGVLYILPGLSKTTGRLIVFHGSKLDPELMTSTDALKASMMLVEVALNDPVTQVYGFQVLEDYSNVTLSQMMFFTPNVIRLLVACTINSVPARYNEFNCHMGPSIINGLIALSKTLISKKLASRIHTHTTEASLHQKIDPRFLPEELGGTAGTAQTLADRWFKHVEGQLPYFEKFSSVTYDASKKATVQQMDGTFRKLNID